MKLWKNLLFGLVFLSILGLFNASLLKDLFTKSEEIYTSDGAITEYIVETSYQQLRSGRNPFERTYQTLYPFGENFSMNDPGIGVLPYYALFRQFLDVHRSMILVLLTNIMLTGWVMFVFLKACKVSDGVAVLGTLVFTFNPFISQRLLGHYTYVTIFVFPLVALILGKIVGQKTVKRTLWAVALGAVLAWTLYLNFYYFIIIDLGIAGFALLKWKLSNIKYWIVALVTSIVVLVPWLFGAVQYFKFENRTKTEGFGGAIYYSIELKNLLLPSIYNPIYKKIFGEVGGQIEQAFLHNWERMAYPGILLLIGIVYWPIYRRKMTSKQRNILDSWMWGSLIFVILMFGPFLKWKGSIDLFNLEGINIVVPLPFLLLHYFPGLESLRVPTRFSPAMVFFAVVGSAYVLESVLVNTKQRQKQLILFILTIIFLLDQFYQIPKSISPPLPVEIYHYIGRDTGSSTVLQIPFTVRDGFRYLGFVHAIEPMQGAILSNKTILGGYFARVSDEVVNYYKNLKVCGYILSITDRGNYDPIFEQPAPPTLYPYPYTESETNKEFDFFGVKYILVKQDEPYTRLIEQIMTLINAKRVMMSQGYVLYERNVSNSKLSDIQFGVNTDDYLNIGDGTVEAPKYRVMVEGATKLLISSREGKYNLTLELASDKERVVELYINEKKGGEIVVHGHKDYMLPFSSLKNGVNIIFLKIKNIDKGEALDVSSGVKIYSMKIRPL